MTGALARAAESDSSAAAETQGARTPSTEVLRP